MAGPSNLHKRLMQSGINGLPPKMPSRPLGGLNRGPGGRGRRDYTPLPWTDYFDSKETVQLDDNRSFNVFLKGESGQGPMMVMLHGGGFSGLTWATASKALVSKVKCHVAAIDLRGHGETVTDDESDLSAETLSKDVCEVVEKLLEGKGSRPEVVLVGHSMGGALAVHVALRREIHNLVGVCVIDVVEGTAMDALASMQTFLRNRPSKFKSLDFAIEWDVRSGQVKNVESARISMPGQLKSIATGKCGTSDVGKTPAEAKDEQQPAPMPTNAESIAEEDEEKAESEVKPPTPAAVGSDFASPSSGYTWRIDLAKTESHWPGWFSGLSGKFLSVPAAKLLLLAGVDRLDKDLTVGQMQGKFQMQILPQAGHAVHEDVPDKVSDIISTFMVRNKFAEPLDSFQQTFPAC